MITNNPFTLSVFLSPSNNYNFTISQKYTNKRTGMVNLDRICHMNVNIFLN